MTTTGHRPDRVFLEDIIGETFGTSSSSSAPVPEQKNETSINFPNMMTQDYQKYDASILSNNIRMEPLSDPNLNSFDFWRCKLFAHNALSYWKVNTLIHSLTAMNAPVELVLVQCPGDALHRAGYSPKEHKIWMCGNHFWNPFEFRRVLTHELVHAFDFARAKIDVTNSEHVACTEVRAWNLSGECDLWTQFMNYLADDMVNRKQRCVKEYTMASMKEGTTSEDERKGALDRIFMKCYKDHWPFTTRAELDNRMRENPMLNV